MGSTYLPLQDVVDVVVQVGPQLPASPTFNQGLIIGPSGVIPTQSGFGSGALRIRQYSTLSGMLADGFTTSSPEYIAAQIYFSQNPASQYVWIGAQCPSGINTLNPHSGAIGTGYVVGDIVKIIQSGGVGGTAQVTSVSSSNGGVTGLSLLTSGQGYSVANDLATTGGTGSGLFVDITVVLEPALLAA
jgi:hypothetical protein